jgi:hypothetical protein
MINNKERVEDGGTTLLVFVNDIIEILAKRIFIRSRRI